MTHEQIQDREIVEQYVRHQLSPADRQAFQEHYFTCDECFEQVQMTTRFVAGVREAAAAGVLAGASHRRADRSSPLAAFYANWFRSWAIPALAASFLLLAVFLGWWALSMRRENQRLAQQAGEERAAEEQLRRLEARVRELEARGSASQQEKEALSKEVNSLKEQLAATELQRAPHVAQVRQPNVNLPTINIYPLGDTQRSAGAGQVNRINLPPDATKFVLILSDFQSGSRTYDVEIRDSSGNLLTRRARLKPDQNGEISVSLKRSGFRQGRYAIKLFGQGKTIAEYQVEIE